MAEKLVMVGVLPEAIVLDAGDQAVWYSNAGNLKIEFDSQRCPFSSNVFQAPPGMRLVSGPVRPEPTPARIAIGFRSTTPSSRTARFFCAKNSAALPPEPSLENHRAR